MAKNGAKTNDVGSIAVDLGGTVGVEQRTFGLEGRVHPKGPILRHVVVLRLASIQPRQPSMRCNSPIWSHSKGSNSFRIPH